MTWLLPLCAGWAVWQVLDRRLPPRRVLELAAAQAVPGAVARRRPSGRPPSGAAGRSGPHGPRRRGGLSDLSASVDLLAVAVSAGYSLLGAVRVAGTEGDGPVAEALGRVAAGFDRGRSLGEGLADLPRSLGPDSAALATTLSVAAVAGTPLGPALQRLADAERRRARRAAEARARRLPVLLLGPLVGLVLPAFVVLTIVPAALSSVPARPVPGVQHSPSSLPPSDVPAATVAPGP